MHEKCPNAEFFLEFFPEYFCQILRIFPYSVRMRENTDQEKTPCLDTFHAVLILSTYYSPILIFMPYFYAVTLSWRRPLSYRNQSIDLRSKSMDWFLYDNGPCHERVNIPFQGNSSKVDLLSIYRILCDRSYILLILLLRSRSWNIHTGGR